MPSDKPGLPGVQVTTLGRATRAENDQQVLQSWLASLSSAHTRRNFEVTARRFLAELPAGGLRAATVEDVRNALARITQGVTEATGRQYVLRVKSLLGYAHRLGYAPINAGATIRVRSDARNRGATLAKRIISEVDVALLVRGARMKRDRVLLQVLYAGGLRVSEIASLTWSDVLPRDKGVQLSVLGKGGIVRQVLLPEAVSRSLLSLRGDASANDPIFASAKGGGRLTERAVLGTVKRAAERAGIAAPISPHWLRHAHASHAIDRAATLPEVQATLGHGNISTTSGYLHARPESSSGLKLDPGVFLR
jgi:integrase/recombinase XerD